MRTETVAICSGGPAGCGECYRCRLNAACRWLAEAHTQRDRAIGLLGKVLAAAKQALPPDIAAEASALLEGLAYEIVLD